MQTHDFQIIIILKLAFNDAYTNIKLFMELSGQNGAKGRAKLKINGQNLPKI